MNAKEQQRRSLIRVLCDIDDFSDMDKFLYDVMTEKEMLEVSSRFQAAQMLKNGSKYSSVIEATGLSSRTVARISDWLKKDTGGYRKAIELVKNHPEHI